MLEPFVDLGVQNLIDFVFEFSIDLDWHWGWFVSTREVVSEHRFQHADVEYWVDSPEFVREFQHVVQFPSFSNDLKGTIITFR